MFVDPHPSTLRTQDGYKLVIWQKVTFEELQHEDVVRIVGVDDVRFSVRRVARGDRESTGGTRLRSIVNASDADFETGGNVFYDSAVRLLADNGLLLRRLYADVDEYDVWATQDRAWSRRGGGWLLLTNTLFTSLQDNIPEDAVLVWRHVPKPDPEEEMDF